jgi:hypothetical protein
MSTFDKDFESVYYYSRKCFEFVTYDGISHHTHTLAITHHKTTISKVSSRKFTRKLQPALLHFKLNSALHTYVKVFAVGDCLKH